MKNLFVKWSLSVGLISLDVCITTFFKSEVCGILSLQFTRAWKLLAGIL